MIKYRSLFIFEYQDNCYIIGSILVFMKHYAYILYVFKEDKSVPHLLQGVLIFFVSLHVWFIDIILKVIKLLIKQRGKQSKVLTELH